MTHSTSSQQHPLMGLEPGSRFGSYDVIRCIGVGGMGSVFEATHRLMGRRVALKVLHAYGKTDAEGRARFMREGATLVRVEHPQIVAVYDAGEVDGVPFLAMELLIGATLDRVLDREGILAPARAVALLAPVADGLAEAHRAGIVHRDVKPENLFVMTGADGREVPKLVDFGIAKDVRATGASKNTMIGTPDYMSPEQLLGSRPVDGRADQYALAVVLYQALTGTRPFVAESVLGLAMLLERGDPPLRPSARGVLVNPALDRAVLRALSIEPADRFASIGDFATALRDALVDSRVEEGALGPLTTRAPIRASNDDDRTRGRVAVLGRATLVIAALALLTLAGVVVVRRAHRPALRPARTAATAGSAPIERSLEPPTRVQADAAPPSTPTSGARSAPVEAPAPRAHSPEITRRWHPGRAHATPPIGASDLDAHPPTDPPALRLER